MFYSFCHKQAFCGYGTLMSPTAKGFGFLQKNAAISFSIRYFSRVLRNEESFTVSYLTKSCGLSTESALSVSEKIQFKTTENPDSVISFFKNHGFSQTQIRKLVERSPKLLLSNPERTLLPKFQFFYSKGIASSELARVLSSTPHVLRYNLDSCIIPNFNSFKHLTQCDNVKVLVAYKNFVGVLSTDFPSVAAPNLAILHENGVPKSFIMAELVVHPRLFSLNHDKFRRTVEEVKRLGFKPSKQNFVVALQALVQISKSTWERKFDVYKKWGMSDEDIFIAFEKFPRCMMLSEHKISATMDFYVNKMGLKSSYVASHPLLLSYSLKRRIIPRCSVVQVLLSKGLIEKLSVSPILQPKENDFIRRFLTPHEDPYLLKLYKEKLGLEN